MKEEKEYQREFDLFCDEAFKHPKPKGKLTVHKNHEGFQVVVKRDGNPIMFLSHDAYNALVQESEDFEETYEEEYHPQFKLLCDVKDKYGNHCPGKPTEIFTHNEEIIHLCDDCYNVKEKYIGATDGLGTFTFSSKKKL